MFTGIIEEIGTLQQIQKKENLFVFKVSASKIFSGIKLGDSIAVDGVCLTVTGCRGKTASFDLMKETLDKTNLGSKRVGDLVNLERALSSQSRIDGHFVTGHVDEVGIILNRIENKNYLELSIKSSKNLAAYLVPKGSICIDGVSLTVGKITRGAFSVYLIPFTRKITTLGNKNKGDHVNVESDILAKYVLRLVADKKNAIL
jgi:riboflavin synthase